VLLYASGTQALTVAIDIALNSAARRIVALPGFACFDVATAAIGARAEVVLYDIDEATLAPDWASFDAALAAGATAAVVAPLYGLPIDWTRASSIARARDVVLIEDAAQSAGAAWRGRPAGSLGELSVLSFGRGKGWTGAGGGALMLRGDARPHAAADAAAATMRDSVRAFAHASAQTLLAHPAVYGVPASMPFLHLGETRYKPPVPLRAMSRFSAALAFATAECSRSATRERASVAVAFARDLEDVPGVGIFDSEPHDDSVAGWLRYPVLVPRGIRTDLIRRFARDGVAASYPDPLRSLSQLAPHLAAAARTPGADRLAAELITLPTHTNAAPDLARRLRSFIAQSWVESRH